MYIMHYNIRAFIIFTLHSCKYQILTCVNYLIVIILPTLNASKDSARFLIQVHVFIKICTCIREFTNCLVIYHRYMTYLFSFFSYLVVLLLVLECGHLWKKTGTTRKISPLCTMWSLIYRLSSSSSEASSSSWATQDV